VEPVLTGEIVVAVNELTWQMVMGKRGGNEGDLQGNSSFIAGGEGWGRVRATLTSASEARWQVASVAGCKWR
jgi:hypothetical protein